MQLGASVVRRASPQGNLSTLVIFSQLKLNACLPCLNYLFLNASGMFHSQNMKLLNFKDQTIPLFQKFIHLSLPPSLIQ
jgi:hypothetical protein